LFQERGFEGPIIVEQRKGISVPVLAAVGGGSGRSDPKIDDSVYRTSKKPEAKVKPTVKAEKTEGQSAAKTDPPVAKPDTVSPEKPKKVRKRIEAPPKEEDPTPAKRPLSLPISRAPVIPKPIPRSAPPPIAQSRPSQCKYWPYCALGSKCHFYHPPPPSSAIPDKYRWSSANAPV
jgi:hypothetical protein